MTKFNKANQLDMTDEEIAERGIAKGARKVLEIVLFAGMTEQSFEKALEDVLWEMTELDLLAVPRDYSQSLTAYDDGSVVLE